ncbi:hypothetical protein [Pseudobutyrivibrio ruminis]|uniref:hypothetical protein n=1 Tax=Pseudobutyrivibrio ruminis TaxID=46206 RepID=UPI0003F6762C|nr:hypothetical protein [Pseudobutyrivibrio ruminis]
MILKEYDGDLFHINDRDTYYAQGISADFVMKKGISVKFNMTYNTKERLVAKYGNYLNKWDSTNDNSQGFCILEDKVLNLVIKRNYRDEPTLLSVSMAFFEMRRLIISNNIKLVSMQKIGCGLEGLNWEDVKRQLEIALEDTDVTIKVYKT